MHPGSTARNLLFLLLGALAIAGLVLLLLLLRGRSFVSGSASQSGSPAQFGPTGDSQSGRDEIRIGNIQEADGLDYDTPAGVRVLQGAYADGVYEGRADGYSEGLAVEVCIREGSIESVRVTQHHETPGFYEYVFRELSGIVVEEQSTDIDTVSGATYTSDAYLVAVEDALSKAAVE